MVRIGPREVLPALRVGPQRERTDQRRFQENQTERIRCPHNRLHIDNLSFRTSYECDSDPDGGVVIAEYAVFKYGHSSRPAHPYMTGLTTAEKSKSTMQKLFKLLV